MNEAPLCRVPAVPDPAVPPATRGVVMHHAVPVYDLLSPLMMFWQEQRANRRALDRLALSPGDLVLDIGCATGQVAVQAARKLDAGRGGFAVGFDASPEMVAAARRKTDGLPCRFDLVAAESLPYPDATFDAAISTFFFHHLDRTDKLRALREARRVLRPGGRFVIADLDRPTNGFGRLVMGTAEKLFRQSEIGENAHGILPEVIAEAGFDVRRLETGLAGYITIFTMER